VANGDVGVAGIVAARAIGGREVVADVSFETDVLFAIASLIVISFSS
jgi:hypothetical protein